MEQQTKAALTIAATGFGVNQYLKQKQRKSPEGYLGKTDEQLKMLGGATAVLATASAVSLKQLKTILKHVKSHKPRKEFLYIPKHNT